MFVTQSRLRTTRASLRIAIAIFFLINAFLSFSQSHTVAVNISPAVTHTALDSPPPPEKYSPLSIGDKMPDIAFKMLNYPSDIAHVSDFRGKLLILDFWATWCSSCISKFPKLDSLQEVYKDKVQIILVNSNNTGDNETKVKDFFIKRKNPNGQPYQLAVAMEDSLADMLFPHREVPHYAWITPEGRVKAITSSHEVNSENIETVINNERINLPLKKDFFPNKLMDLGQGEMIIDDNLAHYSIFKKGRLDGLGYVNQLRLVPDGKGKGSYYIRGKAMRNIPLLDMYKEAIRFNRQLRNFNTDKQVILETKDPSNLVFDPSLSTKDEWEKKNLYTYDLVVPVEDANSLYKYIIRDLNQYSGYYGRIEKRKVKCLTLVRTSKRDKIKSKGGKPEYMIYNDQEKKYMQNLPLSELVIGFDRMQNISLPVVDETGYTCNVDIDLSVDLDDFSALRKALQRYGLDLVEKEKVMDMFVLTEK